MDTTTGIAWLPWGADAFASAREGRKPVLLSIVAPWSVGCREMDRLTYADAGVANVVRERFVAIRVDADHRPDIADRFDFGGLPTTAFLTADGRVLGGGTFVTPDRLKEALGKVSLTASAVRGEPGTIPRPPVVASNGVPQDDVALAELVFSSFDDEHGGFGTAPKFPHAAPVRLALDLYGESGDPLMLQRAARTLDAMGWGGLYDEEEGGFFRCAGNQDWSGAQPEKLLTVNAAMLDLFVHAGTIASNERWFARAVDVVHFIERRLVAANGAWRMSPCADPGRQFADANAAAASAMLQAARVFDDEDLGKRAIHALERVLLASYRPGAGVAHSAAGVRGLLTDQVAMAAGNLDAWEATGNVVYRMMAEELMHYALRTMWDEETGGFFDRAEAGGMFRLVALGEKPFVLNCEAALVLSRLAEAVNDGRFAERACQTLEAIGSRAAAHGPLAAHYLIARRAVRR